MAIDYIIDYPCTPKQTLTTDGIIERLKGEERAATVIDWFRQNGDDRSPDEMGFEFVRSTPEGSDEPQIVVVQDLLDYAAELRPLEHHCFGCPANRTGKRFGCMGFINYPITTAGENWLLDRLPVPDDVLIWMLLRQGIREFKYDGSTIDPLRQSNDIYFEDALPGKRRLGEFEISGNQLFEMLFAVGHIQPNHAAMLLLFLDAIRRDLEADDIIAIAPAAPDVEQRYPFLIQFKDTDDRTVAELKQFLFAVYLTWKLNVRLLLDV